MRSAQADESYHRDELRRHRVASDALEAAEQAACAQLRVLVGADGAVRRACECPCGREGAERTHARVYGRRLESSLGQILE